jgi:hypothetical protein
MRNFENGKMLNVGVAKVAGKELDVFQKKYFLRKSISTPFE